MDSTLARLAAWMPQQRWYASKGRTPILRLVATWDLPCDEDDVVVRTLLVLDEKPQPPVLYQVPVVARPAASVDPSSTNVIGGSEHGTVLTDGTADHAYTSALLTLVTRGGRCDGAHGPIIGTASTPAPAPGSAYTARVLSGEQSNTSVIFRPAHEGAPVICKVFRQVHAGLNPDIELQTALAQAGSAFVPRAVGSVQGSWFDDTAGDGRISGSLAFAQEFLPGVEDAWRVALLAAEVDEDFRARAVALGEATAAVHRDLATLFPTSPAQAEDREAMSSIWRGRLATAVAEVPELEEHRAEISAVYDLARHAHWPDLQRIHGDYHLGQAILVPEQGWMLLDFEGEPMRPMAERIRLDLALRDVAGMLRSFDYVAGSIAMDRPERSSDAALEWARSARSAFLAGYGALHEDTGPLLDALELDKAVYEAVYESRNRPTWLPIPLMGIRRLLHSVPPG